MGTVSTDRVRSPLSVRFPLPLNDCPLEWLMNDGTSNDSEPEVLVKLTQVVMLRHRLQPYAVYAYTVLDKVLLCEAPTPAATSNESSKLPLQPLRPSPPQIIDMALSNYRQYSEAEQEAALQILEERGRPFGLSLPTIKSMLVVAIIGHSDTRESLQWFQRQHFCARKNLFPSKRVATIRTRMLQISKWSRRGVMKFDWGVDLHSYKPLVDEVMRLYLKYVVGDERVPV